MSMLSRLATTSGIPTPTPYSDDVFSTYLYAGNGSTQTITNGIDLADKGGMVWTKSRNSTTANENDNYTHSSDLPFGWQSYLKTNKTDARNATGNSVVPTSTGFTVQFDNWNKSGNTYVSWTFRKAPKFFDVVTWTGNGSFPGPTISHNLGVTPGCIIIKPLSNDASLGNDWWVWHRSLASTDLMNLNTTGATAVVNGWVDSVTSASFTATQFRTTGVSYVAYLFAHDTAADGLIQCGNFSTDASGNASVTLGWEPQYILVKPTDVTGQDWHVYDTTRELSQQGGNVLQPNTNIAEYGFVPIYINSTGFYTSVYGGNRNHIYMAIRRPNKPPTSATNYFKATTNAGETVANPEPVRSFDLLINKDRDGATSWLWADRLRGLNVLGSNVPILSSNNTNAEANTTSLGYFDINGGFNIAIGRHPPINYLFRRAPGFFDEVCYTGTGSNQTVSHNLGAVPELVIVKRRSGGAGNANWCVAYGTSGAYLNDTSAFASYQFAVSMSPSATSFTANSADISASGCTYVTYLFATLPGISKVGTYTGNGSSQTINAGFTTGARFVMVKRTDSTGNWYVWDTARGIVAGNDPTVEMNTLDKEVTTFDSIDSNSSGFDVNQEAVANINVSGAIYLYLAIA